MSHREPDKKKNASATEVLSWKQKKDLADVEEMAIGKQLEELVSWSTRIEAMSDKQLKEYVLNRPESLQSVKTGKNTPGKKLKMKQVRKGGKPNHSSSSSAQGLMATVWKFHREDDDEASIA